MQSWHEQYEASGGVATNSGLVPLSGRHRLDVLQDEPREYLDFRFVWSETRGKLIDLIPDAGRPCAGKPVRKTGEIFWQQAKLETSKPAERLDLSDVPSDAVLVLVARPSDVARHAGAGRLIEAIDALVFGLDRHTIADLQEIRAVFTEFRGNEPHGFVMFRSQEAFDWESFALDLCGPPDGGATKTKRHGKTTYYVANPRAAWFLLDERTMVAAVEKDVEGVIKKLSPREAKPTWGNRWRRVERGQLAVMADLAAFHRWVGGSAYIAPAQRDDVPEFISSLWEEGEQLFVGMRADDGLVLEATVHCPDVKAAQKVRATFGALSTWALGRLHAHGEKADSGARIDDSARFELAGLGRAVLQSAKLTVNGKTVEWQTHAALDTGTDGETRPDGTKE